MTITEQQVYRPLSGFAVGSLFVASAYGVVVLAFGLMALVNKTPLFLPGWTFVVPMVSAALAYAGQIQIRRSEDTRSGALLSKWALILSAVFGLGYFAYVAATYSAIELQSRDFSRKWLNKLQEGEIYVAFAQTLRPEQQDDIPPSDAEAFRGRYAVGNGRQKGPLSSFQESELVRLLEHAGDQGTFEPLGMKSWDYSRGGYTVERNYRLTTPEGIYDVLITTQSAESARFKGRRWQIVLENDGTRIDRVVEETPLGVQLRNLRQQSQQFASMWIQKRYARGLEEAYLDTLDPNERIQVRQRFQSQSAFDIALVGSGIGTCSAPWNFCLIVGDVETLRERLLPNYAGFRSGNFVQVEGKEWNGAEWRLDAPDNLRERFIKEAKGFFDAQSQLIMRLTRAPAQPEKFNPAAKRVQVLQEVEFETSERGADGRLPKYLGEGRLILEGDPNAAAGDLNHWRIIALQLRRCYEPPPPDPRGGTGAP